MAKRILLLVLGLLLLAPPLMAQDGGEDGRRVALVVGNSAYVHAPVLLNAQNDGRRVAEALRSVGFEVIEAIDADKASMQQAIRDFSRALRGAGTGLFYYAGHGFQVNGVNYLVPTDAQIRDEADLPFETIDVGVVLAQMETEPRTNLIFLDACRDNPMVQAIARSMGVSRSAGVGSGLARMDTGIGTLIAFSTAPGAVAQDGRAGTENSPFTTALLQNIATPGLEIRQMLTRVRQAVITETNGTQVPWDNSSLTGDFYFVQAAQVVPDPPMVPATTIPGFNVAAVELSYWDSAQRVTTPEDRLRALQAYIQRYPEGTFADLANIQIAELTRPPEQPATRGAEEQVAVVPPPTEPEPPAADPGAACDTLAAAPGDPGSDVPGVDIAEVVPVRAIEACRAAVSAHPTVLRYQFQLGRAFDKAGQFEEAARFYRFAADKGYAAAQNNLGALYGEGLGVRRDEAEASRLYRLAAAQGYVVAQVNMAVNLVNGAGVPRNEAEAARYYRMAAEQGSVFAQNRLAQLFDQGAGVSQSYEEAARFYRMAAERGSPEAQFALGFYYQLGRGVPQDNMMAIHYFRQAAAEGLGSAHISLGLIYENGVGVAADPVQGARWYAGALAAGETVFAEDYLNRMPEAVRVELAQRLLTELGYDPGPIDGRSGARTRGAIEAFQRAAGLPVTGGLSSGLLAELAKAAAA